MASNDSDPQRNPRRPEDNPFIVFRRFADSQVSSLLNTVFTLPATVANYNIAHQAREKCLFGKADERQCEKLHEIEAEIHARRHDGRDLFLGRDVQAMLKNAEELMSLDRQADELRRQIVRPSGDAEREKELVQRVANEKGQEWGWSHSWGWPTPFDAKETPSRATAENDGSHKASERELMLQLQSEAKELMGEVAYDKTMAAFMRVFSDSEPHNESKELVRYRAEDDPNAQNQKPRVWTWSRSWQWPPPADSLHPDNSAYSPHALEEDQEMKKAGVKWHEAYQDLLRSERDERSHCTRDVSAIPKHSNWRSRCSRHRNRDPVDQSRPKPGSQEQPDQYDEPSYEYSHDHEDQHDEPPSPKAGKGKRFGHFQTSREDEDQIAKQDDEIQKSMERQQQTKQQLWEMLGRKAPEHVQEQEPLQQNTSTELDAYEQLLAVKEQSLPSPPAPPAPQITQSADSIKPSILSTLTTTERTIGPDGSITTKVMLKKRFADGREESSETVHTQCGQEETQQPRDPWKALHSTPDPEPPVEAKKPSEKKPGWFWSS